MDRAFIRQSARPHGRLPSSVFRPVVFRARARARARFVSIPFGLESPLFTQLCPLPRRYESMALLDHENLDVYHRSIEFLTLALRLIARLPRGEREIREQLKRAAMSVPLNIAEGSGKPATADRARFYGIARGSAMECAALMDVCRVAGFLPVAEAEEAKTLLTRIVAMLTRMCRV